MLPGAPLVGCSSLARALLAYTPGDPALTVICSLPPPPRGLKQAPLVTGLAVALDVPSSLPVAAAGEVGAVYRRCSHQKYCNYIFLRTCPFIILFGAHFYSFIVFQVPHVSVAWCDLSGGVFAWHRGITHTIVLGSPEGSHQDNEVNDAAKDNKSGFSTENKLCCGVAWGDNGGDSSGGGSGGWQSSSDGRVDGGNRIGEGLPRWLVAWGRYDVAVFQRISAPIRLTTPACRRSSTANDKRRRASSDPTAAYVLCRRVSVRSRAGTGGAVKVAALRPGRLCVVTVDGWCFDFDLALFP